MKFRKLNRAEHEKTRVLYETVFSEDEKPFVDYYYESRAKKNEIYVAEDAQGIHAMVHLNPYTVSWQGRLVKVPYLVAVATEAPFRHRGLMRELLLLALRDQYAAGTPFAFLMPASEAIYTPFGFRRAWPWRWEEEAVSANVLLGNPEDASAMSNESLQELSDQVNEALSQTFSLFTLRTPEYYRDLAEQQVACGGRLELLLEKGQPCCARCTAKETFPPMMARIVNLERFFQYMRTKETRTFIWRIQDPLLPGNNGIFEITLTPEGGTVHRLTPEEATRKQGRDAVAEIDRVPRMLGEDDPFARAMICEVV